MPNLVWQEGCLPAGVDLDAPWNQHSQVAIHEWLQHQESKEDTQRLKTMGNIVIPLQAKKAISVLSKMQTQLG